MNITWIVGAAMSRGSSGRVVIEIDPELKRELYAELVREGRTLKDWFVAQVEEYLAHGRQAPLFAADRPARPYGKGESADE